jgi:hypothetical protein
MAILVSEITALTPIHHDRTTFFGQSLVVGKGVQVMLCVNPA